MNVPRNADDCLRALNQCHTKHILRDGNLGQQQSVVVHHTDHSDSNIISGPEIASRFAHEVTKALSANEFDQLLSFLKDPKAGHPNGKEDLKERLWRRIQTFYAAEIQLSGWSSDRLVRPGGPEDADLGFVLHLQSEEDANTIGSFWNPRSATIQLLEDKGINEQFAFGYDWHWRAEETFHGRTVCPTRQWNKELKDLHDELSKDVLEILPLPFVITASSCTRDSVRKTLSSDAKSLEIMVAPPIGNLRIDLDFRHNSLKRIFLHVHHPSAGFFSNRQTRSAMALQIDAGLNLFLWLLGRPHNMVTFTREYSRGRPTSGIAKKAPLAEMYAYANKEREEKRILHLEDYTPAFLSWVGKYVQQDPAMILSGGNSIVRAAIRKIGDTIATKRNQSKQSRRKSNTLPDTNHLILDDPLNTKDEAFEKRSVDTFHGAAVSLLPSGVVKLISYSGNKVLRFRLNEKEAKWILALEKSPTVHFSPEEISLRVENRVVYKIRTTRLLESVDMPERWEAQIRHELEIIQKKQVRLGQTQIPPRDLPLSTNDQHPADISFKNGELQMKLIRGSIFPCSMKRGMGRIRFRGLEICVPIEADFKTIFLQCDLTPEGSQHNHICGTNLQKNDPANRLGIKVRFTSKIDNTSHQYWANLKGDCGAKMLNSLVDFLEGKDEDWTAKQTRRYLSRNIGAGRSKVLYTA